MSLQIGIVGLPNVGKSTLFNALLKKQQAYVANFPFATIEPNIGVVPVPDPRLVKLAEVVKKSESLDHLPPQVPATVTFVDIAGLIAGASKGEGLGNKFLHHIREVDLICHVVRAFSDENIIKEGSVNPKEDFETIKTELDLADLETKESREKKNKKSDEPMHLFADKPFLIVLNIDEKDLKNIDTVENEFSQLTEVAPVNVIGICAKTEEELASLNEPDAKDYLQELGINESGLERLIKKAFFTLGLITFLTAGEKEVRAWTIKKGMTAQEASGVIHTDFIKHFIKADVVDYNDFIEVGGWKNARELGKVRSEGRDYIMQDGDVVEFKIGN